MPFSGEIIQRGGGIDYDPVRDNNHYEKRAKRETLRHAIDKLDMDDEAELKRLQAALDAASRPETSYRSPANRKAELEEISKTAQDNRVTREADKLGAMAVAGAKMYHKDLAAVRVQSRVTRAAVFATVAKELQILGGSNVSAEVEALKKAAELLKSV